MKTTDTSSSRLASERRSQRPPAFARGWFISAQASCVPTQVVAIFHAANRIVAPAIAEAGIVVDQVEIAIDHAELLADALDEGAHIGPITRRTIAGDEALAMHQIVDLAIRDI